MRYKYRKMLTYEAVCVFGSETASCTFTVTAVTDVRTKTASITLLCTHRLCHCNRKDKSEALSTLVDFFYEFTFL